MSFRELTADVFHGADCVWITDLRCIECDVPMIELPTGDLTCAECGATLEPVETLTLTSEE